MYIFVYGSLKKDFKFHYLIEGEASFLASGKTKDLFSLYRYKNASFPYMSMIPSKQIKGEVYEINDFILKDLDHLEGYPYFYDRKKISIEIGPGNIIEAITYFLKESIEESGDSLEIWTKKLEKQEI